MRNIFYPAILLLTCIGILTGCQSRQAETETKNVATDSVLPVTYARGFRLLQGDGYIRTDIINPWDTTRLLQSYILIPRNAPLPEQLPQGTIIRTPVENSLVYSSVHCSLLEELGRLGSIGGICDSEYIYIQELQDRLKAQTLVNAGNSMSPDIEQIIALNPDAILLSPYENSSYGRLENLGIPIVECTDYLETSPLGRAEWMRFFGLLYDCQEKSDSLFNAVTNAYKKTCLRIAASSYIPKVISERRTGAVWYVPGGKSYMATLFSDAGAIYPWSDNTNTGSIPLSFETVFEKGQDADFWLIKYNADKNMTYNDLRQEYTPYSRFKAFESKRIYVCNTQKYRYYEETPFHPERLLQDLGAIFHPHIFNDYTPYYFHPLAE